ncbi:CLUMA_CG017510, isoform A [Clunio marinus]|uniref:CLUMA_CG017510, isoform A n=1 Tax=Clunio marinus TaxID=568069 RepID=A0A1J1J0P8_9DIPT|nr:CLUMA_CG017510, isoform A [Clunio marinus]
MLPSNVMSFMKKMVAQEENQPHQSTNENSGTTFGKLKQTLSSSLLTAQDKVNKMSPRPSLIPDAVEKIDTSTFSPPDVVEKESESSINQNLEKNEPNKTANRASSCRVCLKSFKPDDFSKTCFECKYRVCEDCASYSKMDSAEDLNTWRCSVCRRKMSSRICIPQDSTDSNLDVPVLEALQRRHSDAKLNTNVVNSQIGLVPPRSPELRRHSDVSPASLKELEKLKGGGSSKNNNNNNNESEWDNIKSNIPSRIEIEPPTRAGSRRQSIRVSRQHSYDDDIQKNAIANMNSEIELNLGLPGQIPRRKSAYDVFGGIQMMPPNQQQKSSDIDKSTGSRRSSFRIPAQDDFEKDESPSPDNGPTLLIDDDRRIRRRGSQLPDISALRERGVLGVTTTQGTLSVNPINPYQGPALEDLEAPKRQTSLDGEAIKIVIHDVDSGPLCASKRRIILRRDPSDKAHRTRGFGMRVVGGKTGADGKLFAHIVWTVPGGPAEKGGLQQGDKILEWCGVSLVDRSFEEVCSIMDRTADIAELLVEHASDFRMCDLLEDNNSQQAALSSQGSLNNPTITLNQRKNSDVGLIAEPENNEKSPASPTRRKLPKTPFRNNNLQYANQEQIAKEKQVSGRVQIQVWYHDDRNELVVNLLAADDLALRDEQLGYGMLPEAYAKVEIFPKIGEGHHGHQTEVSIPNQSPIWNATITFDIGSGQNLIDRCIEIQLWDLVPQTESVFLGECTVDLQKAFLDDRAVWYRLEDPKNLRMQTLAKCNISFNISPRGSTTMLSGDVSRFIRRNDYSFQRSISDDCDSIGESTSLLHPDHAWFGSSRRGSSQSETLEIETYQLGKDFSKSLPGSRRSSFQDQEKKSGEATPINLSNRRRSSTMRKDPDEILRSLKAVRGELGRTMSLSRETEYNRTTRRQSRVHRDSITNFHDPNVYDESWRGSSSSFQQASSSDLILGPGQRKPHYHLTYSKYGDLFLEFKTSRSLVEMRIMRARNLLFNYADAPDTFVECYIKDGMNEKIRQRKKTAIIRQNVNPDYNYVLTYTMSDIYRRSLIFIVWQKASGFESSIAIGAVEIYFGKFNIDQSYSGWYPLFPTFSMGLSTRKDLP